MSINRIKKAVRFLSKQAYLQLSLSFKGLATKHTTVNGLLILPRSLIQQVFLNKLNLDMKFVSTTAKTEGTKMKVKKMILTE